jgi:ubiquinone/menaquinone biosynthesis C-methylase UbiE
MPFRQALGTAFDHFLLVLQPPSRELAAEYQSLLSPHRSLLDLGCGSGNHLEDVKRPHSSDWVGVDSHQASIDIALSRGRYDRAVVADIIEHLVSLPNASVDVVLASCVIEHLPKQKGLHLLQEMKRVARSKAIIFTPNGFVPQPPDPDNPANEHISG